MIRKIKCPNCGAKINDNSGKHVHRDKICNNCKIPYRKVGLHLPSFSLDWIKRKLSRNKELEELRMQGYRGRARKQLRMENAAKGDYELISDNDVDQRARQLFNEEKAFNKRQQLKHKGRM